MKALIIIGLLFTLVACGGEAVKSAPVTQQQQVVVEPTQVVEQEQEEQSVDEESIEYYEGQDTRSLDEIVELVDYDDVRPSHVVSDHDWIVIDNDAIYSADKHVYHEDYRVVDNENGQYDGDYCYGIGKVESVEMYRVDVILHFLNHYRNESGEEAITQELLEEVISFCFDYYQE